MVIQPLECSRRGNAGGCAEKHAIERRKQRAVQSQAEHESEDDSEGKSGCSPQAAGGVPQVLRDAIRLLEPTPSPDRTHRLGNESRISEPSPRPRVRLSRVAGRCEFFGLELEMVAQLARDLVIGRALSPGPEETHSLVFSGRSHHSADRAHERAPFGFLGTKLPPARGREAVVLELA